MDVADPAAWVRLADVTGAHRRCARRIADTPWLPGTGVMQHAPSVLVLDTVPAMLCRLAQDRADRNLRRGGALPPVQISTEVDDAADLAPARPVPQPS